MEQFRLVKDNDGRYQNQSGKDSNTLEIISAVLEDGGINYDFLFEWISNTHFSTFYSNLCAFIKVGNKIIIARQSASSGENYYYFDISHTRFIDLVGQWKKINEQKPQEVVITRTDGNINLEYVF